MPKRAIYIAVGDGGGAGTRAHPHLAATAARFDEILRGVPEEAHIHLGPGVFFTRGLRHSDGARELGWNVRSGWTITGAGEDATVIRLECWPDFPAERCRRWAVVGCAVEEPVAGVVIEHLTVDANWRGLPNRPEAAESRAALHGVACFHHGPLVHRDLRVGGFYGRHAAAVFAFGVRQLGSSSGPALTIERLTVFGDHWNWAGAIPVHEK